MDALKKILKKLNVAPAKHLIQLKGIEAHPMPLDVTTLRQTGREVDEEQQQKS